MISAASLLAGSAFGGAWTAKEEPDLKARLAAAAPLPTEDLGVPVTATQCGELMMVPNPDGKTYDLLQWYWPHYGGPTEVIIMDLGTGVMKKEKIPDGLQIHICGRALAPNGKLYFATPNWRLGMCIFIYDPATDRITSLGESVTDAKGPAGPDKQPLAWRIAVPDLAGERRDMVVGTDGKIYATGSYGKESRAGAYQIDPDTDKITIYGPVGPSHKPSGVWGYFVAADDRYVYVASGKVPWYLVAYDRETKTDKVLLTTETVEGSISVWQQRYGCSGQATKVKMPDGTVLDRMEFWLHEGRVIPRKNAQEKPPWQQPAKEKPWVTMPPKPELWLGNATPTAAGDAAIWHRSADAKTNAPAQSPAGAKPENFIVGVSNKDNNLLIDNVILVIH